MGNWLLAIFVVGLTFAACSEEKEDLDISSDYQYFPLEVGKYWVYEVDSVIYSLSGRDSTHTFIKDTIIETFIANNGDTIYRGERYERATETAPWQFATVFSMSRNKEQAFRTENNLPLVKLVFPLRRPDGWNSAALIDPNVEIKVGPEMVKIFEFWGARAEIDSVGQPMTIGKLQFPETAKIVYVNRNDIQTVSRIATEIYAKEIGLIKRDWQILDGTCDTTSCNSERWRKLAKEGFVLSQRLVDHN